MINGQICICNYLYSQSSTNLKLLLFSFIFLTFNHHCYLHKRGVEDVFFLISLICLEETDRWMILFRTNSGPRALRTQPHSAHTAGFVSGRHHATLRHDLYQASSVSPFCPAENTILNVTLLQEWAMGCAAALQWRGCGFMSGLWASPGVWGKMRTSIAYFP